MRTYFEVEPQELLSPATGAIGELFAGATRLAQLARVDSAWLERVLFGFQRQPDL